MHLSASPTPNTIVSASVHLSTHVDWGRTRIEDVQVRLDERSAPLELEDSYYDPLWDGPTAPPADPADWSASPRPEDTPLLTAATTALRDAITGIDLVGFQPGDTAETSRSYGMVHLRFAERPVGLDHLRPFEGVHGEWTIGLRTSLDDLFGSAQLAPVVHAARAVIAAARRAPSGDRVAS